MIRERAVEAVEVTRESHAFQAGWKDGRFGESGSFAANENLGEWSDRDRLCYYRGHREGRRIREILRSGEHLR